MPQRPDFAYVDGNKLPKLPCAAEAIIGGDAKVPAIAAASIIAKVTRDRLMAELCREYPGYDWAKNAGYGEFIKTAKEILEELRNLVKAQWNKVGAHAGTLRRAR